MMFILLATATWGALAGIFLAMWLTGAVQVAEHSTAVRLTETVIFLALFVWGVRRWHKRFKRVNGDAPD